MRAPRHHAADTIFHVTTHGVDDRPVFLDNIDRRTFVNRIGHMVVRLDWTIFGACLMTTHYHLLIGLSDANLSAGMTIVNGAHARLFDRRHDRRGPVFEARYDDKRVDTDGHLLAAIRYLALNPLEARMVERPQDWVWSTYGQLIGTRPRWPWFDPDVVLARFLPAAGRGASSGARVCRSAWH